MIDLWPEDMPSHTTVKPPVTILREQASLLDSKTLNIVEAKVKRCDDIDYRNGFKYRFLIIAPALNNYQYSLFYLTHPIEFYPTTFYADKHITDGLPDKSLMTELPDNVGKLIANDIDEFNNILKAILATDRTKRVIEAVLAQSVE